MKAVWTMETMFVWPSLIFDSLDHHLLLYRLSGLGVGGVELQWFVDYLTNHKQHVGKGNHYSDWAAVLGGIPQGSGAIACSS